MEELGSVERENSRFSSSPPHLLQNIAVKIDIELRQQEGNVRRNEPSREGGSGIAVFGDSAVM